jgi:hypothetical protein
MYEVGYRGKEKPETPGVFYSAHLQWGSLETIAPAIRKWHTSKWPLECVRWRLQVKGITSSRVAVRRIQVSRTTAASLEGECGLTGVAVVGWGDLGGVVAF